MVKAIVLSGGSGKRMGSDIPKQYLDIAGKKAIVYALKSFQESQVDEIVLVCAKDYRDFCRELIEEEKIDKCKQVVVGGAERYHSVYEGLKASAPCDYVLIHDGARVCITPDVINMCVEKVQELKACVVGVKAVDTMQLVDEQGMITSTPDRRFLWTAQTPQCFSYDTCISAYEKAIAACDDTITDDAMVVRKYGEVSVYMVEGDPMNLKLTRPSDIKVIESFLTGQKP